MATFMQLLQASCLKRNTLLMAGIDPPETPSGSPCHLLPWSKKIVDATKDAVCGYKPNAAFFEREGAEGLAALKALVSYIHDTCGDDMPVLIDAKRGDIGSTATAYAQSIYELGGDGVTLSPLMGYDSVEPFLKPRDSSESKVLGGFVLCKTSNPGSNDFLNHEADDEKLYQRIAKASQTWCDKKASGNIDIDIDIDGPPALGLVVGATDTEAIVGARESAPLSWILAPGVGAQGGDLERSVEAGLFAAESGGMVGGGIIFPISRGISKAEDVTAAANNFRDQINQVREKVVAKQNSQNSERDAKRQKNSGGDMQSEMQLEKYQTDFIHLSLRFGVLKFGSFTLKSGRTSPYFFNAGLFSSGSALSELATAYANAIMKKGVRKNLFSFDVIFGPAYKGISLGAVVAAKLYELFGVDVGFTYNRKEAKDHGEGGLLVGADIKGKKVLVLDDVITAGTAIREAHTMVKKNGGNVTAIVIALDRMEKRGEDDALSATGAVGRDLGLPVIDIVNLKMLIGFLQKEPSYSQHLASVREYRERYGVKE